jgi:MinD superfamily P-loop ATPase
MTPPAVVLIGADKGGVGKTTVARTLLDYFAQNQIRTRAFDTEIPRGTLPPLSNFARATQYRLHRSGQKGRNYICRFPHSWALNSIAR